MGGKQARHKYKSYNHDIVRAMYNTQIKWNRRLLVPMFHPEHTKIVAELFADAGEQLRRISLKNSLTRLEKLVQSHYILDAMAHTLKWIKPEDPRQRGAEEYQYQGNGFQNIHGLEDLDKIINDTLGEEDERGDHIQWRKWTNEGIARDKAKKDRDAHFKHNQPPEEDGSNAEGYDQGQLSPLQSLFKNKKKKY